MWRHGIKRVPFRFEPTWWSIVFPLGMYAVAGIYLGRADDLPIVAWIGETWMWVAVAAWLIALVGMIAGGMLSDRLRQRGPGGRAITLMLGPSCAEGTSSPPSPPTKSAAVSVFSIPS